MSLLANVKKSDKASYGGISRKIYYARIDQIDDIPKAYPNPTTVAENVSLQPGDITMKSGETFKELDIILEKGDLSFEAIGDTLVSSAFKNKLKTMFVINTDEAMSFVIESQKPNAEFIFIIPDNNGVNVVAGTEFYPMIREAIKGGKGTNVEAGEIVDIDWMCKGPVYKKYSGIIPGFTQHSGSDIIEVE